mgnify:CR=1 FL=1
MKRTEEGFDKENEEAFRKVAPHFYDGDQIHDKEAMAILVGMLAGPYGNSLFRDESNMKAAVHKAFSLADIFMQEKEARIQKLEKQQLAEFNWTK